MTPVGRFRFSLETVLRVRELREEQARLQLARSLRNLERRRQALQDTEHRLANTLAAWQEDLERALTFPEYRRRINYLDRLKGVIQIWKWQLEQEEAEVQRQKLHLLQLHRERRLLSNLRDKKFAQFQREVAKIQEKEGDEAVLQRWPREPAP